MNKKILITGACGFIGSHLAEYFIEAGYEIIAFDRYNSDNHYTRNIKKYGKVMNSKKRGSYVYIKK